MWSTGDESDGDYVKDFKQGYICIYMHSCLRTHTHILCLTLTLTLSHTYYLSLSLPPSLSLSLSLSLSSLKVAEHTHHTRILVLFTRCARVRALASLFPPLRPFLSHRRGTYSGSTKRGRCSVWRVLREGECVESTKRFGEERTLI